MRVLVLADAWVILTSVWDSLLMVSQFCLSRLMKIRRSLMLICANICFGCVALLLVSCSSKREPDVLQVKIGGRSMSKLPFVIAYDQGLYEKYGLEVELLMGTPEFEGARDPHPKLWRRVVRKLGFEHYPETEITVSGHAPAMHGQTRNAQRSKRIAIAATDCSVRGYVVARSDTEKLEDIKGKRIGINSSGTTSAFAAYRLVERMGWGPDFDVSILEDGRTVADIEAGLVDVVIGGDETYEEAHRLGYSILEDTRNWGDELSGNSAMVDVGWLEEGDNREQALQFLKAVMEALAIFIKTQSSQWTWLFAGMAFQIELRLRDAISVRIMCHALSMRYRYNQYDAYPRFARDAPIPAVRFL